MMAVENEEIEVAAAIWFSILFCFGLIEDFPMEVDRCEGFYRRKKSRGWGTTFVEFNNVLIIYVNILKWEAISMFFLIYIYRERDDKYMVKILINS